MQQDETAAEKLEKLADTSSMALAIERLEKERKLQEEDLQQEFHSLLDALKPKNILKNTVNELQESTPLKQNLLKLAVGLGAGYFSRKIVVNKSAGALKKALGTVLQYGVTHLIARKDDENGEGSCKKGFLKRISDRVVRRSDEKI